MLPIAPLMIEHRLIEKLIKLMEKQAKRIRKNKLADIEFVDDCIDFIKTYADWCHHGKEEDILFRSLKEKKLSDEHLKIVNELIKDHNYARRITSQLVEERNNYMNSANEAEKQIISFEIYGHLKALVSFYPEHIKKEDKEFFVPCMEYFTARQKKEMLQKFQEFDGQLIHKKYQELVKEKSKSTKEEQI
jgi:hemerythrin-like domain-containing protein